MRVLIALAVLALTRVSPANAQTRHIFGAMVPMRDGIRLAADIWLPQQPGRYPVLIARTPYMRTGLSLGEWGEYFARRGYVFISQDTRGRGDSEGHFDAFVNEGSDGYDTIEWSAKQSWSNGRVGTLGLSYLGLVQWLTARLHPPHLACMAPTAAAGRWFEEIPYMGGAFLASFALSWANQTSGRIEQEPNAEGVDWNSVWKHRPLITADSLVGRSLPLYRKWLEHPTIDAYWNSIRFTTRDFVGISIPTLTVTGWFDGDQPGAIFYWRGVMANARKRDEHFFVSGPWRHIETFRGGSTKVGEMEFSPESVIDTKTLHLAFFDWCLKESASRFDAPRSRVYVTGANVWRSDDAYPPSGATDRRLFLASRESANSAGGDGTLRDVVDDSPADHFIFDPRDPVPGEMESWGMSRTDVQRRNDVLVYSSAPLTAPVDAIGSVAVELFAATDGRDTDFTAALSDVAPDGTARLLGPFVGIRRARYRNGYLREELVTPGKAERYRIELFDIAHRFDMGHRIRVEISSSASPAYVPNHNTGNPVATDTTFRRAQQTILHDRAHPSALILTVVPTPAPAR